MLHNFEFIRTSGCADMKIRRKSIFDLKTSLLSRRWLVDCALSTLFQRNDASFLKLHFQTKHLGTFNDTKF